MPLAGLVSIALCDHPEIERILRGLIDMGYSISPASLRLDDLTEPIVRMLHESGERSITIAPETGSDRLRRVINKTVTNAEILERAELIFASGLVNLKLYYMIGLPTETDDDIDAIRELTAALRGILLAHSRTRGHLGRIVASVNPLIPKPGTTYQWLPNGQVDYQFNDEDGTGTQPADRMLALQGLGRMRVYALNAAVDTRRWAKTEISPLREGVRPEPPAPSREDEQRYNQTSPQRDEAEDKKDE